MSTLKIVVTGPPDAGKTTFVSTLSESAPLSTEQTVQNGTDNARTTVALDLGRTTIEGHPIKLFGTPGQERFSYMREILAQGADGIVLLLPSDREGILPKMRTFITSVAMEASPPIVVGITRTDLQGAGILQEIRDALGPCTLRIARLDARKPDQCRELLSQLIPTG